MPPTTKNGSSNKVTDSSMEGVVDSTFPGVPIMTDTQCLIDKYSTITWLTIKDAFNMKELPKDLEDREVYENVKKSRFQKVACRYPVLPFFDAIKWIIQCLETKNIFLNNVSGQQLASYQPHNLHSYYKFPKPKKHFNS